MRDELLQGKMWHKHLFTADRQSAGRVHDLVEAECGLARECGALYWLKELGSECPYGLKFVCEFLLSFSLCFNPKAHWFKGNVWEVKNTILLSRGPSKGGSEEPEDMRKPKERKEMEKELLYLCTKSGAHPWAAYVWKSVNYCGLTLNSWLRAKEKEGEKKKKHKKN